MKTLYYTIEKEVYDDTDELNGNKNVTVYEIKYNIPIELCVLPIELSDISTDKIREWLEENELDKTKFCLKQL